MKNVLFIFVLIYSVGSASSQGVFNPPNIGFELNNFSNWYLYTGNCCPGGKTNAKTYTSVPIPNRHTITSGVTVDTYGKFPIVSPDGDTYSVKLGNGSTNKQAERMRYYLRVPNGLDNYSLVFRYAVVFQDPGHPVVQQPRFEVSAFDSATLSAITCAQFSYISSSSLPGFAHSSVGTDVIYRPWSTGTIDLSGFGGKTVAIDFATGDCNEGGHFGYAYIDMSCGLFAISGSVCRGTTTTRLTAPSGFQNYTWCDTNYVAFANTQNVDVPTPAVRNRYIVILTPYTGYGCPDTLSTELFVSDLDLKLQKDTSVCKGQSFQLNDSASCNARFLPLTYQWLSGIDELSCSTCLNPIASPKALSTNYILKVSDSTGCSVTDTLNLRRRTVLAHQQNKFPMTCRGDKITLSVKDSGQLAFTLQWFKNGTMLVGETNDSIEISSIQYGDTGFYFVQLINSCDTTYSDTAQLRIYLIPRFIKQPIDMHLCRGTKGRFIATVADTSNSLQWFLNGLPIVGATNDTFTIDSVLPSDTGNYSLRLIGKCDTVFSDTVHILFKLETKIIVPLQPALSCIGDSVRFIVGAIGDSVLKYTWYQDTSAIAGLNNDSVWILTNLISDFGNYQVTVSGGCGIVKSAKEKISMKPIPPRIFNDTTKVCTFSNQLFASGYDHYLWSDGDTLFYTTLSTGGLYWVKYRRNDQCNNTDTTFVELWPMPQINAGHDTLLCNEAILQLQATTVDADSMRWLDNAKGVYSNNTDSMATFTMFNKPVTSIPLIGMVKNYCGETYDTLLLTAVNRRKADFRPSDTMVCEKSVEFDFVPMIPGGVFEGSHITGNTFNPAVHGDYPVTYRLTQIGCTDTLTGMMHVNTQPKADFVFVPDSPFVNQTIEFTSTSTNALSLEWNYGNVKLTGRDAFKTAFASEGIYPVQLIARNFACIDSITKDVVVDINHLWIPDAFTPNGDSYNDVFRPGIYRIKVGNMSIYDRWGAQVFYTEDLSIGWDGKFNGKSCPNDVYMYLLKFEELPGKWKALHGTVTLIR